MRDIVFIAVVIAFFLLAAVFVRACEALMAPFDDQLLDIPPPVEAQVEE
jgi:hypothetical protein